jgi:hypothetical protein
LFLIPLLDKSAKPEASNEDEALTVKVDDDNSYRRMVEAMRRITPLTSALNDNKKSTNIASVGPCRRIEEIEGKKTRVLQGQKNKYNIEPHHPHPAHDESLTFPAKASNCFKFM